MTTKNAENNVDFQERAAEFAPNDFVVPFGYDDSLTGRVTAVWPAIGMVDVEFATGNKRFPVEELSRINPEHAKIIPPLTNSAPGEGDMVSVPGGPFEPLDDNERLASSGASLLRVAHAFVKQSLYWASKDRRYRATRGECDSGTFSCPKCGEGSTLRRAIYKRREGVSERLMACSNCLFLIKRDDIEGPEAAV